MFVNDVPDSLILENEEGVGNFNKYRSARLACEGCSQAAQKCLRILDVFEHLATNNEIGKAVSVAFGVVIPDDCDSFTSSQIGASWNKAGIQASAAVIPDFTHHRKKLGIATSNVNYALVPEVVALH